LNFLVLWTGQEGFTKLTKRNFDSWYEDHLFISAEAKRHKIYLDTFNRRQIVANCIIDLAFGYMKKFGAADGRFVSECLASAVGYFSEGNNIHTYFVYSSLLARQLDKIFYENQVTELKSALNIPEAKMLYEALMRNEEKIKQLGYQGMPQSLYNDLMTQHEFKGRKQQEENLSGKQKRDLFIIDY
jgi:hypothetical protein